MPILNEVGLSLVDILLLAIILIAVPLESFLSLKKTRAELASGRPGVRIKLYSQTIMMLWGIALPILVWWAVSGRSWEMLGFTLETGLWAYIGWGLAILIAGFFAFQYSMVRGSASVRADYQKVLAQNPIVSNFLPHTDEERRVFTLTGVTAGITEEIIFRGYLIWALSLAMPLWAAALGSLLIFTLLHLYQGAKQIPFIFAMGGLVTLVFVLSGSIWPAIALHIFVDVIQNETIWKSRELAPA